MLTFSAIYIKVDFNPQTQKAMMHASKNTIKISCKIQYLISYLLFFLSLSLTGAPWEDHATNAFQGNLTRSS